MNKARIYCLTGLFALASILTFGAQDDKPRGDKERKGGVEGERREEMRKRIEEGRGDPARRGEALRSMIGGEGGERMREFMKQQAGRRLNMMDENKDGKVTEDEYVKAQKKAFFIYDANNDGALTLEELENVGGMAAMEGMAFGAGAGGPRAAGAAGERPDPSRRIEELIKQRDKDGDGLLSKDEFAGPEDLFADADANKDEFLNSQELINAVRDNPRAMFALGGPGAGLMGRPGAEGLREGIRQDPSKLIEAKDKDHDGKLTRQELEGREEMFDRLDKNQDGFVDKIEIEQGIQRMREAVGPPRRPAGDETGPDGPPPAGPGAPPPAQ